MYFQFCQSILCGVLLVLLVYPRWSTFGFVSLSQVEYFSFVSLSQVEQFQFKYTYHGYVGQKGKYSHSCWGTKPFKQKVLHVKMNTVKTAKLWNRKTTIQQFLSVFDVVTKLIVLLVQLITHKSSEMGLFTRYNCYVSCLLDCLKS